VAVHGLLLAAGGGSRMGLAKALLTEGGVPRTLVTARELRAAGCDRVTVVLGARAEEARALLDGGGERSPAREPWLHVVVADRWATGLGASLRTGLDAVTAAGPGAGADAALVTLVDLLDVGAAVMRRVVEAWREDGAAPDALVRATYGGQPGHPVLVGRGHWAALAACAAGDVGAQPYLGRHRVRSVSCDDLATGRDVDRPEDLVDLAVEAPVDGTDDREGG